MLEQDVGLKITKAKSEIKRNESCTYTCLRGNDSTFLGQGQCFDGLNHEVPRKVTADETDHLVVVQASDRVVVRRAMEDLPDLLQEAFPVELSGTHEGVLSQQNVLASQGCVETTATSTDLVI